MKKIKRRKETTSIMKMIIVGEKELRVKNYPEVQQSKNQKQNGDQMKVSEVVAEPKKDMTVFALAGSIGVGNEALKYALQKGISFCDPPHLRSAVKAAKGLDYFRANAHRIRYHLASESLGELTRRIDDVGPALLGFHYARVLKNECEFLVPYPIDELASVDKILEPFIRWRLNHNSLNCRMLGLALQLFIVLRVIRFDKKFQGADFSDLIHSLENCPIEIIEPTFESAVGRITEKGHEDEQA